MTVESNYVIAIATLSDWLKRLAPNFQPMRSKTKTNRTMYTSFFPRFERVKGNLEECYMQCGVWNQMKIWSSHLLDNLSNCLMNLKNSGDSTGFEPMTSAMPVQCSNQLSYEVTQWRAGQFVGLMFSRERNVIWKNVICSAVFEINFRNQINKLLLHRLRIMPFTRRLSRTIHDVQKIWVCV